MPPPLPPPSGNSGCRLSFASPIAGRGCSQMGGNSMPLHAPAEFPASLGKGTSACLPASSVREERPGKGPAGAPRPPPLSRSPQQRDGTQGHITMRVHRHLTGGSKGAELCSLVTSDKTRGNCMKLCQGSLRLVLGKGYSTRGCLGAGTGSPGHWSQPQACQSSKIIWTMLLSPRGVRFLGCSVPGQELDSMILVGHCQLWIFHGISSGLWKPCSCTTMGSASHPAQVQEQRPSGPVGAQQEGKCQGHTAAIHSHLSWLFLRGSTDPGGLAGFSLSGVFCSVLKVQTTCSEAITEQSQPAHKQQPRQSTGEGKLELKKSSAGEGTAQSRWCGASFPGRAAIAPH
ncbi:uncharacterized protein LOC120507162 [Passer montanus]|uniref:uncharacterized protein LOC120507162 n=1 Tax=Passer montanus TaxID=9160 RepID=UPI00195F6DE3|nr:uncharacterized protein LOC120507162 [Passer montanus]